MRQSLVIAKSLYGKDRPLYADHLWTVRYNFDLRFKLITSGLKVIAVIVIHFQNEVQFDCIQDSLYCQQILFVHMLYSPLNSYMIALSELYNEVFRLKQCCWLLLLVMQHSCKRNFLFFYILITFVKQHSFSPWNVSTSDCWCKQLWKP